MTPDQIDEIASVADHLAPVEPAFRHQRLFSDRDFDLYEESGNYEDQRNELERRRQAAVKEIAASGGAKAVLAFASAVSSPWRVGLAAGAVVGTEVDRVVLPDLLEPDPKEIVQFTGGYVWSRYRVDGWPWVDDIDTSHWTASQIGQFLSFLPFGSDTWERVEQLLGTNEFLYWGKTSANPYETESRLALAIDRLVQYGRPNAALRCLHREVHEGQAFDGDRAVRVLLAAVESTEDIHSMDAYQTVEIIKALQLDLATAPEDLLRVEWAYLPLLDRHSETTPKLLWQRLATEPQFFCEVIRLVFRSKMEERPSAEPTAETSRVATNAYRLLSEWQTPPGCQVDGTYDGDAFNHWLAAVKQECIETGHLEIAMTMLGHALVHVTADPDGLWIHRAVAAALNAKDAADMRDGFRTELYNSRGAHWVDPTGTPERELATQYRVQAEAVESHGFHRVATTLRDLAASYVREAERVASREQFDE
jgi:hypothetical protein